MSAPCHHCSTVAHGYESEWGAGEIRARWVDTDGSVSNEVYSVCLDCLRASAPGGPGYQAVLALEPCDKCGALGPYERGAHHTRRVPHNGEMEWDVFPICDSCAAARGDARR